MIAFLQSEKYLSAFFFSFRPALMTMIVATILGFSSRLKFKTRKAIDILDRQSFGFVYEYRPIEEAMADGRSAATRKTPRDRNRTWRCPGR